MKIETGKYYKTRDGNKVGPMYNYDNTAYCWNVPGEREGRWSVFGEDGYATHGAVDNHGDIIAEWQEPMKYKVGDKVRIVAQTHGHRFEIGSSVTICEVLNSAGVEYYDAKNDNEHWYLTDNEIEPYTEPATETIPTARDAFTRIHAELNDAVNAMLDMANYEDAIEYAVMMHAIELEYLG